MSKKLKKRYVLIEDQTDFDPSVLRWSFDSEEEASKKALEVLKENHENAGVFETFDDYDKSGSVDGIVKEELAFYSCKTCLVRYLPDWIDDVEPGE